MPADLDMRNPETLEELERLGIVASGHLHLVAVRA
jgi:hypothetical protein